MATSASQRRLSAEQVQVFVERHDEARGSHHHCTQTNGHAPLRILHLAPQRRLGLLKVDLGEKVSVVPSTMVSNRTPNGFPSKPPFVVLLPRRPERVERRRRRYCYRDRLSRSRPRRSRARLAKTVIGPDSARRPDRKSLPCGAV